MDVDFEFTVARLAKIANNNNFVGLLGNSGPPRRHLAYEESESAKDRRPSKRTLRSP
jgi:hypothetical protein